MTRLGQEVDDLVVFLVRFQLCLILPLGASWWPPVENPRFGETTKNPQFSRAGRWFLEETWWLWDFCLVDILMASIQLASALWRENLLVSGFIAALFLGWRFAGPSQQKTNVFGLQPLNNADVPKIYPLFPSQFVHVSGEPCWLSGDSPPISLFTRVSWLAAKKSERLDS